MQNKTDSWLKSFGEIVAQALTKALRECATREMKATPVLGMPEPAPTGQATMSFGMIFGGSLQGRAVVSLNEAEIAILRLRGGAAGPEGDTGALMKLLQVTCARIQELAGGIYGALTVGVELAEKATGTTLVVEVGTDGEDKEEARATLSVHVDPQLTTALGRSVGALFPDVVSSNSPAENLDLVLDVELNATLRFGQRQLSLREILDLSSGSVVELDRQVDEPVELVLDGRVVARGEAVIIDGNYGMRITEILHPVNG